MGEMAVMVFPALLDLPDHQDLLDTWCCWNTRCGSRPALPSATHCRHTHYHTHYPATCTSHYQQWGELHLLGKDLLANSA